MADYLDDNAKRLPAGTRPMESAPEGDGWILGLDGQPVHPWIVMTRCDDGWRDRGGNTCSPGAWVPLPDPQPRPTGWVKATGMVKIAPVSGRHEVEWAKWMIYVALPDGAHDPTRHSDLCETSEAALRGAREIAEQLGLPIDVEDLERVAP